MNEENKLKRQACLIFSRVVGYISPTINWNPGKISEKADRKMLDVSKEAK